MLQNAADAILEAAETGEVEGRVHVRVSDSYLYVGNTGAPLSRDGIKALLGAHSRGVGTSALSGRKVGAAGFRNGSPAAQL
jgi:hypothetical protein